MEIVIEPDKQRMGRRAAAAVAQWLKRAVAVRDEAFLILATGASQFEMLDALVDMDVEWRRVTCFHLDEYVGLPQTHPASFRRYLRERFVARVPGLREFVPVQGDADDPQAECARLSEVIGDVTVDVAAVGIGENGHLAFNDPPADFETEQPYILVELDEACRRQQLGEGWFDSLEEVPRRAISMSIKQIMKSRRIVCTVPDRRKAQAVWDCLQGPVSPQAPASILQRHPRCAMFLDEAAASLLGGGG